jgi:hypothetical protein
MSTLEYKTIHLDISASNSLPDVLKQLHGLDFVVVNVHDHSSNTKVFFCLEHLEELLQANPSELTCEVVSLIEYKHSITKSIQHLLTDVEQLQNRLFSEFACDLAQPIADVLTRTKHLLTLVSCFALQKNAENLMDHISAANQTLEQISLACFYYDDNVRCYDGFRFELIPQVVKIEKML